MIIKILAVIGGLTLFSFMLVMAAIINLIRKGEHQ